MCELRPLPEQVSAITELATEHASLPSTSVPGRRSARLYQHVDDPACLLYVAEWDSREVFEAYRQTAQLPGAPDQYRQAPSWRVYRRLALFERVLQPADLAYADIVDGPPESHAARRDLALDYHRTSPRSRASLVLLMIHETVDEPPGLLIVSGWQAGAPLVQSAPTPDRALVEQLRASGATVEQFVGRALADTSDC